jgi:hypothetical protein
MTIHSLLLATSLMTQASAVELQDLANVLGPAESRRAFEGIVATAEVTGPRGSFTSEIISLADGTTRFRLIGASTTELAVVDGVGLRRSPAGTLDPAQAVVAFVRGHEVHRMLVDLERVFAPEGTIGADGCVAVRFGQGGAAVCGVGSDGKGAEVARLESIVLAGVESSAGEPVTLQFGDWRVLHGVELPFAVEFLHAGERHSYRYVEVLPFGLAPGSALPADTGARLARLGDLADLVRAHHRAMVAHRAGDIEMLAADEAPRSLVSGRGSLRESGRDATRERLGAYLQTVRFDRYDDVVVPVVAVAQDGSLGWLACQIEASGTSLGADGSQESLSYGFSWVELYGRSGGQWLRVGNASSAKP